VNSIGLSPPEEALRAHSSILPSAVAKPLNVHNRVQQVFICAKNFWGRTAFMVSFRD